jgi:precorrin-6B methylase 2
MSKKSDKIGQLRAAAKRATEVFLAKAPERGHGAVEIEEDVALVYRRVDREYGVFVWHVAGGGSPVALDKAPDALLIKASGKIEELFSQVWENDQEDEKLIESAIDDLLSFCEQ